MSGNPEGQPSKPPKLMDPMRAVLRVQRYALRTERAYCDWVRRYVKFHRMRSREDLADGTRKVEAFLTHLAVEGQVAASTQNQALSALLFLYERVLEQPMEDRIDAVRARRPARMPMEQGYCKQAVRPSPVTEWWVGSLSVGDRLEACPTLAASTSEVSRLHGHDEGNRAGRVNGRWAERIPVGSKSAGLAQVRKWWVAH